MADFYDLQNNIQDLKLPLGFTFSFPCEQEGLAKARLVKWTKGFSCTGLIIFENYPFVTNLIYKWERSYRVCQGLWASQSEKHAPVKWKMQASKHQYMRANSNKRQQMGLDLKFLVVNYQLKWFRQSKKKRNKIVVWFLCLWRPRFLAHTVGIFLSMLKSVRQLQNLETTVKNHLSAWA